MRGRRAAWPLFVVGVVAGACTAPAADPPPTAAVPRWRVEDGHIRDQEGRAVILRGLNLSGEHKVPPYFDYQQPADYARVRTEWGMNTVRFLVEWAALVPRRGEVDAAYLAEVVRRMDWAHDAGLLVVLDMHQDIYGEGFLGGNGAPRWTCDEAAYAAFQPATEWYLSYLDPNVVACFDRLWNDQALQQDYADAWAALAGALGAHPAVIGFDVMNEPFLGSYNFDDFEPLALQPFYELVVPVVRAAAPEWLAFLEPSSMRNLGRPTRLSPFPFHGVVYAPHAYDNAAERGMGFEPARAEAIASNMALLAGEATALNAALWIGEYGGRASHPGIGAYMTATTSAANAHWAGQVYWHYGMDEGYGLLHDDGTDKTELMDAIVQPAPLRVDGTPGTWTYEPSTRELHVTYTAAGRSESAFSLPARSHAGAHVQCTGCASHRVEDGTLWVTAEAGTAVDLRITP